MPHECCTLWHSHMVCLASLRSCTLVNSGAPALLSAKKQWLAGWKSLECTTTSKRARWRCALMAGMISAAPATCSEPLGALKSFCAVRGCCSKVRCERLGVDGADRCVQVGGGGVREISVGRVAQRVQIVAGEGCEIRWSPRAVGFDVEEGENLGQRDRSASCEAAHDGARARGGAERWRYDMSGCSQREEGEEEDKIERERV